MAAESGWNAEALQGVFLKGLSEQVKDELVARVDPASLDILISLAIRTDNRLCERRRERASHQFSTQGPLPTLFLLMFLLPILIQPLTLTPPQRK